MNALEIFAIIFFVGFSIALPVLCWLGLNDILGGGKK